MKCAKKALEIEKKHGGEAKLSKGIIQLRSIIDVFCVFFYPPKNDKL